MNGRKLVYLNEFNVRMGHTTYFPFVSGILHSYAVTKPAIAANYAFAPYVFYMDDLPSVLRQYDRRPDVAAFSVSMWNEQLSLQVASGIKARWPDALVVFGGPQVPHDPGEYMKRFPFIDVAIRAEGEEAFAATLERFLDSADFRDIPNVSFRSPRGSGEVARNSQSLEFDRSLDDYPSPYLEDRYGYMMREYRDIEFQAIIETNRGCPFLCTFCYWGRGGTTRRYRYHELDRVFAEIDWAGRNGIRYMFNADSNFGMHRRDREIAEFLVATKKKYGFPEKFRTCWGKNTDQAILEIAALLHAHDMEKGVTLARQTNTKLALANIKRGNIKLETYENLQHQLNDMRIPVYTEMILGMPGETYETWKAGLEQLLQASLKNQIFVYQCEVYPNTEMGEPEYQARHGIRTRRIELREIHGSIRDAAWVREYQDIVVETGSMPLADWRRMTRLSTVTMLLHSMKLGFFVMSYIADRFGLAYMDFVEYLAEARFPGPAPVLRRELDQIDAYADTLLDGGGRGVELPEFGPIYWDIEEACFLRISTEYEAFFDELEGCTRAFLAERDIAVPDEELREVMRYQRIRMASCEDGPGQTYAFGYNMPEYFERRFGRERIPVIREAQSLTTSPRRFHGDRRLFARDVLLWGRKSGTMLVEVDRHDEAEVALSPASGNSAIARPAGA